MMRSIEVEGTTVEAAVELGLSALGIVREDAVVEVVSSPDASQGRSRARVKVSKTGDVAEPTAAAPVPPVAAPLPPRGVSRETTSSTTSAEFPGKQAVVETLKTIIEHLEISPAIHVPNEVTADGFVIEVSGDGAALLIGRHGQMIEATEYLLNRIAVTNGAAAPRILVDVEGYRARREQSLEEMARRTADIVRASGRPQVLQPMSPRDRRIVHVALQGDATVATHSEGDGTYRTLVISPAGQQRV